MYARTSTRLTCFQTPSNIYRLVFRSTVWRSEFVIRLVVLYSWQSRLCFCSRYRPVFFILNLASVWHQVGGSASWFRGGLQLRNDAWPTIGRMQIENQYPSNYEVWRRVVQASTVERQELSRQKKNSPCTSACSPRRKESLASTLASTRFIFLEKTLTLKNKLDCFLFESY